MNEPLLSSFGALAEALKSSVLAPPTYGEGQKSWLTNQTYNRGSVILIIIMAKSSQMVHRYSTATDDSFGCPEGRRASKLLFPGEK